MVSNKFSTNTDIIAFGTNKDENKSRDADESLIALFTNRLA